MLQLCVCFFAITIRKMFRVIKDQLLLDLVHDALLQQLAVLQPHDESLHDFLSVELVHHFLKLHHELLRCDEVDVAVPREPRGLRVDVQDRTVPRGRVLKVVSFLSLLVLKVQEMLVPFLDFLLQRVEQFVSFVDYVVQRVKEEAIAL